MTIKSKAPLKKIAPATSDPNADMAGPAAKKETPKAQRVTFSVSTEPGRKVFVAGTFNNWDPNDKAMSDKKGDGVYTVSVSLPAGDHQYKFVIDGTWCADPACANAVQNDQGTVNSLLRIKA